jgi:hypothetical protein
MNNLEVMSSTFTRQSQPESTLRKEKNVRKREVVLARISVYIVVLMVSCHTVRIIPTVWEIVQTLTMDTETQVEDRKETYVMIFSV